MSLLTSPLFKWDYHVHFLQNSNWWLYYRRNFFQKKLLEGVKVTEVSRNVNFMQNTQKNKLEVLQYKSRQWSFCNTVGATSWNSRTKLCLFLCGLTFSTPQNGNKPFPLFHPKQQQHSSFHYVRKQAERAQKEKQTGICNTALDKQEDIGTCGKRKGGEGNSQCTHIAAEGRRTSQCWPAFRSSHTHILQAAFLGLLQENSSWPAPWQRSPASDCGKEMAEAKQANTNHQVTQAHGYKLNPAQEPSTCTDCHLAPAWEGLLKSSQSSSGSQSHIIGTEKLAGLLLAIIF